MLGRAKIAGLLVSALVVSGQSFAGQASLSQVTDFYVDTAFTSTSYDVQNKVYADILNAAHKIELQESEFETRVLISAVEQSDESDKATAE